MYETFIDLDELIVRCRDKQAKKFIQEAVACYRAGAFRSCIVATWNAVVFDFLHKLRELELLGNGEASNLVEDFEKLSSASKLRELWQFESRIPELSLTKFELISPVEKSDIERLFEDRSRCAHPSMTSLEEPFEATAELARYHLRSAVTHLLQRPPVQGRSASKRIFQDIESEYFPVEPEKAVTYFQKGPLARARIGLVKDVVRGLTVSLLIEDRPEDERARQFSALNAVSSMYHKETGEILNNHLSDIILNKVTDNNWHKVIIYLGTIKSWESLSEPCQLKARAFIDKLKLFESSLAWSKRPSHRSINILTKAIRVDFLKELVRDKFRIPLSDLLLVQNFCKEQLLEDMVIKPLLVEAIPQASLNELVSMLSNSDKTLNALIEPRLKEKIQKVSLEELLQLSRYRGELPIGLIEPRLKEEIQEDSISVEQLLLILSKYNNGSLKELIKNRLKEVIKKASLYQLLSIRKTYESELDELGEESHELVDSFVKDLISKISFDELLTIHSAHRDELIISSLKPLLKENIPILIDKFINSGDWRSADFNASLLVEIADFLTLAQWTNILNAFCSNDQIYGSYGCPGILGSLFRRSLGINCFVQPYWLSFRENLNKLKGTHIDRLKQLIDSYRV